MRFETNKMLEPKPFIVEDKSNKPLAFVWPEDVSGAYVKNNALHINTKSGGMLFIEFDSAEASQNALGVVISLSNKARKWDGDLNKTHRIIGTNGLSFEVDSDTDDVESDSVVVVQPPDTKPKQYKIVFCTKCPRKSVYKKDQEVPAMGAMAKCPSCGADAYIEHVQTIGSQR